MKWNDSRVKSPPTNAANSYYVIWLSAGIQMIGFATWMPDNNYTEGSWTDFRNTNGNRHDITEGIILYWFNQPNKPVIAMEKT